MKKKILALTLACAATLSLLAGCGGKKDDKTVVVGASPTPHAGILEVAKEIMAEEGYNLEIKTFNDYIMPNEAVEDGSIDANYFQHITYMNNFN